MANRRLNGKHVGGTPHLRRQSSPRFQIVVWVRQSSCSMDEAIRLGVVRGMIWGCKGLMKRVTRSLGEGCPLSPRPPHAACARCQSLVLGFCLIAKFS